MSDKKLIQSDTSRTVKNPLLSAAVTGLTFDDFTHNAVLLPAAIPPPPPPPPSTISSSVAGKECKLFFFICPNNILENHIENKYHNLNSFVDFLFKIYATNVTSIGCV